MHPPPDFGCGLRHILREGVVGARFFKEQRRFCRIERAKRQDTRQQSRGPIEGGSEFLDEGARGALRRHIDRRIREGERRQIARKTCDDAAVKQRFDECLKKWRAGRDGENGAGRH